MKTVEIMWKHFLPISTALKEKKLIALLKFKSDKCIYMLIWGFQIRLHSTHINDHLLLT